MVYILAPKPALRAANGLVGLSDPGLSDAVAPNRERVRAKSNASGPKPLKVWIWISKCLNQFRNFLIPKTSSCFSCKKKLAKAMPLNLRAVSSILLLLLLGKRPTFIGPAAPGLGLRPKEWNLPQLPVRITLW